MQAVQDHPKSHCFDSILPKIPLLSHFKVTHKLGHGSFGSIYAAYLIRPKNKDKSFPTEYAIKIETFDPKSLLSINNRTLSREAKFLYTLKDFHGFPRIFYCSSFEDKTILIMERLGDNLETIFNRHNRRFTLQTVLLFAIQALERLKVLSDKGIVHRDLKPENFLIGVNQPNVLFLIDFGLSKRFLNEKNEHLEPKNGVGLVGTPRYTSIGSHLGLQQSRKDDLESLGYIMVYFLKGKLPWMDLNPRDKQKSMTSEQKNNLILKKKQSVSPDELCESLPVEFLDFFLYLKSLKYHETPDFMFLIKKFKTLFKNPDEPHYFDWELGLLNNKNPSEPVLRPPVPQQLLLGYHSEKTDNLKASNDNLRHIELNFRENSKIPKKSIFLATLAPENSSVEDKINANFLNDVSVQDEELTVRNQKTVKRKIVFQPLRNGRGGGETGEIGENLEEEETVGSLGKLMKYLEEQKKTKTNLDFQSRLIN